MPVKPLSTGLTPRRTHSLRSVEVGKADQQPGFEPAFTDVDWAPWVEAAMGRGARLTGRRLGADAFVRKYCGGFAFSANVERVTRGAVALTYADDRRVDAEAFGGSAAEASAAAVRFAAGLAMELAATVVHEMRFISRNFNFEIAELMNVYT